VAEIVSPDDRPGEYLAKVAQWLDAGTALVCDRSGLARS
jgi:hypothetical protein